MKVVFQAQGSLKSSSKDCLPRLLSVFVPSRGELHLQAWLCGGWLLLQRELAASADVLPNADQLLVGRAHSQNAARWGEGREAGSASSLHLGVCFPSR